MIAINMSVLLVVISGIFLVSGQLTRMNCMKASENFKRCLSDGYQPKILKRCTFGEGPIGEKREKKCKNLEADLMVSCEYVCPGMKQAIRSLVEKKNHLQI